MFGESQFWCVRAVVGCTGRRPCLIRIRNWTRPSAEATFKETCDDFAKRMPGPCAQPAASAEFGRGGANWRRRHHSRCVARLSSSPGRLCLRASLGHCHKRGMRDGFADKVLVVNEWWGSAGLQSSGMSQHTFPIVPSSPQRYKNGSASQLPTPPGASRLNHNSLLQHNADDSHEAKRKMMQSLMGGTTRGYQDLSLRQGTLRNNDCFSALRPDVHAEFEATWRTRVVERGWSERRLSASVSRACPFSRLAATATELRYSSPLQPHIARKCRFSSRPAGATPTVTGISTTGSRSSDLGPKWRRFSFRRPPHVLECAHTGQGRLDRSAGGVPL